MSLQAFLFCLESFLMLLGLSLALLTLLLAVAVALLRPAVLQPNIFSTLTECDLHPFLIESLDNAHAHLGVRDYTGFVRQEQVKLVNAFFHHDAGLDRRNEDFPLAF